MTHAEEWQVIEREVLRLVRAGWPGGPDRATADTPAPLAIERDAAVVVALADAFVAAVEEFTGERWRTRDLTGQRAEAAVEDVQAAVLSLMNQIGSLGLALVDVVTEATWRNSLS